MMIRVVSNLPGLMVGEVIDLGPDPELSTRLIALVRAGHLEVLDGEPAAG